MSTKSDNLQHYSLSMEETNIWQVGYCCLLFEVLEDICDFFFFFSGINIWITHWSLTNAAKVLRSMWLKKKKTPWAINKEMSQQTSTPAVFLVFLQEERTRKITLFFCFFLTQWQQNNPEFSFFFSFFLLFPGLQGQRKIYADFIHNKYTQLSLQSTATTCRLHTAREQR